MSIVSPDITQISGETNLRKALRRLNPELYRSIASSHDSWVYEIQKEEERNGAIW